VRSTSPVPFTQSMLVKARTLTGGRTWSAVTEAALQLEQRGVPIRITQIMYSPPGGDAYEYLEIQNVGSRENALGGFTLEGVTFRFPQSVSPIAPGARWVVASSVDPLAFANRYPQVQVHGYFTGSLGNGGEIIALRDAAGAIVTLVAYDDENGWPLS